MKASYKKYILDFKRPSGTSRGVITQKETWFLVLEEDGRRGIGECGLLRGLSYDDVHDYENRLLWVCNNIEMGEKRLLDSLKEFPSIQFGIEQSFRSLALNDWFELFPSPFTQNETPIPINGLIWMGDVDFMSEQIEQKLEEGFTCIKMKIGAMDFNSEVRILESIRKKYSKVQVELRVDANGAFKPKEALEKLKILADLNLHSIEQPIKQGDWPTMQELCKKTPLPIALDEELIGLFDVPQKERLLQTVRPHYIVLKPSLIGGYEKSQEWIDLAENYNIGWWITSALESNIGLNAIAQWTATLNNSMPQGLGTGGLFTNNFDSPLQVENGNLYYKPNENWNINLITEICT